MERKKRKWTGCVTLLLLLAGCYGAVQKLNAEEVIDGTYGYTLEVSNASGVKIKGASDADTLNWWWNNYMNNPPDEVSIENISVNTEDYPKIEGENIIQGKLVVEVDTEMFGGYDSARGYFALVYDESCFSIKNPETSLYVDGGNVTFPSKVEYKKDDLVDGTKIIKERFLHADRIEIGSWEKDGKTYTTFYDLQLINRSETDFVEDPIDFIYFKEQWDWSDVNFDEEKRKIVFENTFYLEGNEKPCLTPFLALGKKMVWDDGTPGDGSTPVDLTNDRTFTVSNADGSVSHEYKVHRDMPWVVEKGREDNYRLSSVTSDGEKPDDYGHYHVYAGSQVEIIADPVGAGDKTMILDQVVLTDREGNSVKAEIVENSTTFSFTMPKSIVTITEIRFKEAEKPQFALSGTVPEQGTEMGRITFSNQDGGTITSAREGDTVTATATAATAYQQYYDLRFDSWSAEGIELKDDEKGTPQFSFVMPGREVKLTANFQKAGTAVEISSPNYDLGKVWIGGIDKRVDQGTYTDVFRAGATISFDLYRVDNAQRCTGWKIQRDGQDVSESEIQWNEYFYTSSSSGQNTFYPYRAPTVTISGGQMTVAPIFTARKYAKVSVRSADPSMGSVKVGSGKEAEVVESTEFEGDTVTITAAAAGDLYRFDHWEVTAPAEAGKVALADPKAAETTFSMIAEPVSIQAVFAKAKQSSEKQLLEVVLLDKQDSAKTIGITSSQGTAYTVTLPESLTKAEAEALVNGGAYLKIRASEGASVAQEAGYADGQGPDPWSSGKILCAGFTLNQPKNFTVTAEDGSTQAYTVTVAYDDPGSQTGKPVLKEGNVERLSDTEAKVVFQSDTAGKYYFQTAAGGAAAPQIDTSGAGLDVRKGNNTITLTTLTAGAKDLYLIVKSSTGEQSETLKIAVPAYEAKYKISLSYPTAGGAITVSSTEAKEGDTITVTVTPKSGKRMTAGSLKYSPTVAGAPPVAIDEKTMQFTMPAGNISISCTWEDDGGTVTPSPSKKLTSFVIGGVNGAINETAGTVTVTLPYGTDLTSLVPTITGEGIVSVSPQSGTAADFSKTAAYTVTFTDGTVKTYQVSVYTEAQPKSDAMWDKMLEEMGGSTDSSGSNTWWEKAKRKDKGNSFPSYW